MRVRVKICGITNLEDARCAVDAGADAVGFIFVPKSARYIDEDSAGEIIRKLKPFVTTVGVFVDESVERIKEIVECAGLGAVQLHGEESPEFVETLRAAMPNTRIIKALRISDLDDFSLIGIYAADAVLLDTFDKDKHGGTGKSFDWDLILKVKMPEGIPLILAGGLNPGNAKIAADKVRPFALDVSSGVEAEPGKKDPELIRKFIESLRS